MQLTILRFNADELHPDLETVLQLFLNALRQLPFIIWPQKSARLAEASAKNWVALSRQCGLQTPINEYIAQLLDAQEFAREKPALLEDGSFLDNRKTDFVKKVGELVALIEVQFGNSARIDSDLMKLANAFLWGASHLGIIACPVAATSAAITGGGITFESLVARVNSLHPKLRPGPLVLVGMSHEGTPQLDLSRSKIQDPRLLSGNSGPKVSAYVVRQLIEGVPPEEIALPVQDILLHEVRPALVRLDDRQTSLF